MLEDALFIVTTVCMYVSRKNGEEMDFQFEELETGSLARACHM